MASRETLYKTYAGSVATVAGSALLAFGLVAVFWPRNEVKGDIPDCLMEQSGVVTIGKQTYDLVCR